ncbi:hypothetical protein HT136_02830 [Novosphingobium profundi]|uniref:putative quinol monooxygenase n=1 Tax=Novosphingobium profundi TaxID=1774954 RepID=UPI001BDB65BE|nr:hypothetical protein [Novosphingobium profundi]MBT0667301.1 hypothetical protein [Novosphingobium profundi]
MNNEIYSIYHLSIQPSDFPEFLTLIGKIVDGSSQEPGTLTYEFVVNADKTAVHILERYAMEGLIPHVEQTFAPFAEEFLRLCKIEALYVYGNPTAPIRAKLDSFGAVYLAPFAGFTRS